MKNPLEGARVRKLVRGNLVTDEIYQLNCLLVEGELAHDQPGKEEEKSTNV